MANRFTLYHAGALAIDKDRPWQLITDIGALCGKFATHEQGMRAKLALEEDQAAGKLPCNLSTWDKHYLLEGKEAPDGRSDSSAH